MGESRTVDDMACELWGEIEGVHCYSYLKPVEGRMEWRPYLGSEIALPQAKGVSFRVASAFVRVVVCSEPSPESPKVG
jgi:hypothetical protein